MRVLPLLLASVLAPATAHACGGFFCNTTPDVPGGPVEVVDQAGEDVLFYTNVDTNSTTMHIQVEFEGEASDFAWVIPVKGDPQIELSTDAIFPILRELRAQYQVDGTFDDCNFGWAATGTGTATGTGGTATGTGTGTGTTGPSGGMNPGVDVVRTDLVGPYETVVLQANDAGALVDWLETNAFEIPPGLDPVLAPYISPETYFVALRLQKTKNAGDLQPLSLTYPGTTPMIPIQLTSVAATPDMRLRVYILGDARAVPLSYLHVRLNPLAIDFWNGGTNLEQVITRAADEAGGHAFFTDYSGSADELENRVFRESWDLWDFAQYTHAGELIEAVLDSGIPLGDRTQDVLSDHLGLPTETDPELDLPEVIECLTASAWGYGYTYTPVGTLEACWGPELARIDFDPVALADDLETYVLEPRRNIERALEGSAKITRLTSSLSPSEMTVDPTFGFNDDLPNVKQRRRMEEVYVCDGERFDESWRRLETEFGEHVWLPPLDAIGTDSPLWWLRNEGYTTPASLIIERTTEKGPPHVLVDNTLLIFGGDPAADTPPSEGCGCQSTAPTAAWLFLAPLFLVLRRRA